MNFESHNPATGERIGTYPERNRLQARGYDRWHHFPAGQDTLAHGSMTPQYPVADP